MWIKYRTVKTDRKREREREREREKYIERYCKVVDSIPI